MKTDFKDLIVEAAVCQIAVDDFHAEGDDNKAAYSDLQIELCRAKINLVNYILENPMIKMKLELEQTKRLADAKTKGLVMTHCVDEEILKLLIK
jgi:hypothetical protein